MKPPHSPGGFTLIEMVFFIMIAGVSLVGIIPLFGQVLTNSYRSNEEVRAYYLIQEKLATLRSGGEVGLSGVYGALSWQKEEKYGLFDPINHTLTCTTSNPGDDLFRCVTISVTHTASQEKLAQASTILKPASP